MAGSSDKYSDDYVAKLLQKDAEATSKEYKDLGMSALLPKRPAGTAPKPNTRFLKNILRDTNQHNAALIAAQDRREESERTNRREAEKKEARRRSRAGRLTLPLVEEDEQRRSASKDRAQHRPRKRRRDEDDYDERDRKEHRSNKRSKQEDDEDEDHRAERKHRRKHVEDQRKGRDDENHGSRRRGYHYRSRRRSQSESDDYGGYERRDGDHSKQRRGQDHSRDDFNSRYRSRSRSRNHHRRRKKRRSHSHPRSPDRARSKSPRGHHGKRQNPKTVDQDGRASSDPRLGSKPEQSSLVTGSRSRSVSKSSTSSDPLEHLVGPLPAPKNDQPIPRGRGALKHSKYTSGIDARFSSSYNPAHDRGPSDSDSDTDTEYASTNKARHEKKEDDWGMALEALRDREKWRAKGAERMREAGWGDEVVKAWEENAEAGRKGGSTNGTTREKDENDVVWAKRGEGREWDKGKVIEPGGDGEVELKPEWAKDRSKSKSKGRRLS